MHVLHVCQPSEAGVPRVVVNLAEHQLKIPWRVTVAGPPHGGLAEQLDGSGVSMARWEASREPRLSVVNEVRTLATIVSSLRPDIVHLHSAKAGLAGRLAIRGRLPTVYQPHAWSFYAASGLQRTLALRWERRATKWTDLIVAVSQGERLAGEQAGIRGPYTVIPNGVQLVPSDSEGRLLARQALGLPLGPLVVCLGRLCAQKGQDRLLDIWGEVQRHVPEASLYLVGDGPDMPTLRRGADGLSGVHLPGATARPDQWFEAADLVVLPSRWEAGLSLVAMEAMSHGRSVISSDVPGAREGILPGGGLVVSQGDRDALRDGVVERLLDTRLARAEGECGQERIRQQYRVSASSEAVAKSYEAILQSRTDHR